MTRLLFIAAALLFFVPGDTRALSCAPPQFDADAIEQLDIIFAGVVEKQQPPSLWQRIRSRVDSDRHGRSSIYTFRIMQLWKGRPVEGDRVEVIASPGWEQETAYQPGQDYLVFGDASDEPGRYTSSPGWCGYDLLPRDEVVRVLEQYRSHRNRSVDERVNAVKATRRSASDVRDE